MPVKRKERKPIDQSKLEMGINPPSWVDSFDDAKYTDAICKVLTFFLAYTPVKGTSARGIPLTEYGWSSDTPKKKSIFTQLMLRRANLEINDSLFSGEKREDECALFEKAGMGPDFFKTCSSNRIALISSGSFPIDILKAIRNSIAHTRFIVVDLDEGPFLAMENGMPKGDSFEVKARLFLSVSTLEAWTELIRQGKEAEESEIKRLSDAENTLKRNLLQAIRDGQIATYESAMNSFELNKGKTSKLFRELKGEGLIDFSRKKHCWVCTQSEGEQGTRR